MSHPSSPDKIVSPFPFNSKKEWDATAKQELDGADPIEKLKHRIDEIDILPYYDPEDASPNDFRLPISQNEFLGPRTWFNLPLIKVYQAKVANEQALLFLNSGADGILFDLLAPVDPKILLNQIELPYCSIVFLVASGQEDFFDALKGLTNRRKYVTTDLSGAIFWKSGPVNPEWVENFKGWSKFHSLGIIADESTSPTTEIAAVLAKAVKQLDYFAESTIKINPRLHSTAFSVSTGSDFFFEIAKLKALRILWNKVAGSYDPQYTASVHIHANIKPWINQAFEPYGNMIHETTAAMSAILGGCDSLTVQPQDQEESGMMSRIALNVSAILREESHFGKVADPTAGSYYLNKLTDQLSAGAWLKFQHLMK